MSSLVLQPCRVLDSCFAETQGEKLELSLGKFRTEFLPKGDELGKYKLSLLREGAYVGNSKTENGRRLFVLLNPDRSGKLDWIAAKDPSFTKRVERVYRVESIDRGPGFKAES